jgi:PAS domain S-box-containing protein
MSVSATTSGPFARSLREVPATGTLRLPRDSVASDAAAVVMLGRLGRVLGASEPALTLMGRPAEEVAGRPLSHALVLDDRGTFHGDIRLVLARAVEKVRREMGLLTADGTEVPVQLTLLPLDLDDDPAIKALAELRDARTKPARDAGAPKLRPEFRRRSVPFRTA